MELGMLGKLALVSIAALLCTMLALPLVEADPVRVSWYITNGSGIPIDGAMLTIYYAYSPNGPFNQMPADDPNTHYYVLDEIANVRQNPVITDYWNPDHPRGMAVADVHPNGELGIVYFYVKIEFDTTVEYWPKADSIKPGDLIWAPVVARGSPSGYAAAGPGIGTGPTAAYPNHSPPNNVIPEVPIGPSIAAASMVVGLALYIGFRRWKPIGLP